MLEFSVFLILNPKDWQFGVGVETVDDGSPMPATAAALWLCFLGLQITFYRAGD